MKTVQTIKPVSFEAVWALIQEVGEKQKETARQLEETGKFIKEFSASQRETDRKMQKTDRQMKETDRIIKEVSASQKETAQQMKETDRKMQETDRQMKETGRRIDEYNRRFGDFTNRFGEVVEYMIAPNLRDKFKELKHDFPKANSGTRVDDHKNNIHFEIDVMLENGNKAMLVEVKTKLTTEHVREHIKRLEKMRTYANLHQDKRTFLGAVAGVVMTSNVKNFALKQGLYVVEPSGETFFITSPEGDPKEW